MPNYKKFVFTICLALFAFAGVVTPRPANAFSDFIGGPTSVVKWVWEKTEKVYDKVQGMVGAELSNRTVGMFLDSLAYDVATQLAEGGPGGKPQFRTISIKKSLQNAGNQAMGEFLGELTNKGFDKLGINLCDPSLSMKLTLTLSLVDSQLPPEPSCDWRSLQRNWSQFDDNIQADIVRFQLDPRQSGNKSAVEFFKNVVSPKSSDLGAWYKIDKELNRRKIEAEKALEIEAEECQGYIDSKTPITDEVITHCSINESMGKELFVSATEIEAKKQEEKKKAAEAVPLSAILRDAGNRFLDTFTSKLMNNWIKRGMWSLFGNADNDIYKGYRDSLIDRLRGGADIRQPRGADIFKELRTVNIETIESYSYINEFTICPDQFRKPDNCVMSPAFLQALNNKITIQQAVDKGIIDGDTLFVHPNDAINHTVNKCYRDGLCYSNLVKLRKANMIPVGWEMAALRAPISLQQAMNCFEENANCGLTIDETPGNQYMVDGNFHNPFYHLVDPDWVMKAPAVRCDAYAYAPILESPDGSNRQQYCADAKVCLAEDSEGNCLEDQYNYCTRTENIWNFEGKTCPGGETYAGCLTFVSEDFGAGSYIEDTLEYCTADQAGCRRYSQEKDSLNNWALEDIAVDFNDLFLNNQAEECSERDAGCSEYIVTAPDTGANLIPNSDFEIDLDDNDVADGFSGHVNLIDDEGINDSRAVLAAYRTNPPFTDHIITCYYGIPVVPNTNYTVSVSSRINPSDPGNAPARIAVNTCQDGAGNPGGIFSPDASMATTNDIDPALPHDEANAFLALADLSDSEYTRFEGTFNSSNSVMCGSICVGSSYGNNNPHYFDELKLEVVSEPLTFTNYSDYGAGARIYMDDNTVMCTADEVGCQGYIPRNSDPMIPAVITQDDICPAECVGYETFTEQPDGFDIIEGDTLVEYYNFIPNTAQECPDQEVGCEEFTNLEVVAAGGEGREYFSYIRQCVTEDLGEIYYTWEGTEVSGYQIKTWYSLPSDAGNPSSPHPDAPCTNMDPEGSDCRDTGPAGAYPEALCTIADLDTDLNCREFYDADGNPHYRLQDRVIFATDNCHDYRRTLTGQVYKAVPEESTACAEVNNGCREYYGNNANNVRLVLSDNFEQGTYAPWISIGGSVVDLSNESLNNNGHSLRGETGDVFGRDMMNVPIQNNKEYKLSWWMKSESLLAEFYMNIRGHDTDGHVFSEPFADSGVDSAFQNIEPGRWHYYTASAYIDTLDVLDPDLIDEFEIQILTVTPLANQGLYIDNFIIKEVENSFSVVRNSWDTPVACNQPYEAYHLGCQPYIDLNGQEFNLKSFDHLCREEAIGCMPVIDTHNSTNPFTEIFNIGDYSEITVPADSLTYLVPNPNNYCSSMAKGCMALGLPDRTEVGEFDTKFKINDPDEYASIMCDYDGLNCTEYATGKGTYYLKDPGTETCIYQQNTLINGSLLSGWFKTANLGDDVPLGCADTDGIWDTGGDGIYNVEELILPRDYCTDGAGDPLYYFTRNDCEDNGGTWNNELLAAQCPANENLCTSFRDPVDPINCDPKINNPDIDGYCSSTVYDNKVECTRNGWDWTPRCKDYYYYANEKIDETSCNGLVNRQGGCVLFYEANNWNGEHSQVISLYDTNETYENIEADNRPYSPVACDPSFDPTCVLDSNRLIKVNKDRQCAEWLACKSSTATLDEDTDTYKIICDDLDTCIEFQFDTDSNSTKCKKWGSHDTTVEALTFEKYQSRDTGLRNHISWSDKDYIGYSLPNVLPVSDLTVYSFDNGGNQMTRLVYDVTDSIDGTGPYFSGCVDSADSSIALDGQSCTATINTDGDYQFRGECQQRICWVQPKANSNATSTYAIETRAYAAADSPFPSEIQTATKERSPKYKGANICSNDPASPNTCELSYKQVSYGKGQHVIYYPEEVVALPGDPPIIPLGICTSGDPDRLLLPCTDNVGCDTISIDDEGHTVYRNDGLCSLKTEEITFRSWPGICLEYDNDIPITMDLDNSYYCNQWYPAQKIKGTASLYDNYQESGYFEASSNDALFCAVAEPYVTTEDRYYCGYFTTSNEAGLCNVLMKVPAGSKVNLNAASQHIELLDSTSWIEEGDDFDVWLHDAVDNDVDRDIILPPGGGLGAKFNRGQHFGNVLGHEVNFVDIIDTLFDATEVTWDHDDDSSTAEVLRGIHRFYYDDGVGANGNSSGSYYMNISGATHYGQRDQCQNCHSPSCPTGTHQVYTRCWRKTHCGWHMWRHRGTWCNPYTYNYYVDLNSGTGASNDSSNLPSPEYGGACGDNCRFISPSNPEFNHGRGCLQTPGMMPNPYATTLATYASSTLPGGFNLDIDIAVVTSCLTAAGADTELQNNCRYVSCIQTVDLIDQNDNHLCSEYRDELGPCSQYIQDASDTIISTDDMYQNMMNCFTDGNHDFDDGTTPLIPLTNDGQGPRQMHDPGPGAYARCLVEYRDDFRSCDHPMCGVDDAALAAFCGTCSLIPAPIGYDTTTAGLNCDIDADGNPAPLNCYQQCRIVTHLDSDGLLSAVRTDIWWRNETFGVRFRDIHPWISYYWDPAGQYVTNDPAAVDDDDVLYGEIAGLPENPDYDYPSEFAPYGAGLAVFNPTRVISTRVPYYRFSPDNVTAATFFAYLDETVANPLATAVNDAQLELQDLFYRIYNLEWTYTEGACTGPAVCAGVDEIICGGVPACTWVWNLESAIYEEYAPPTDLAGGNNTNTFAGEDYRPRVLATCGDSLCGILDIDGNVIEVEEGISVNGISGGTLIGQDASLFVSAKFFYHAHPDHMPVYSVDVDWGDGAVNNFSINPGKYRNSLPADYCNFEVDAPGLAGQLMGFAGEDRACQPGYKIFYHDYLYDESRSHDCNGTLTGAPDTPPKPIIANASCYQPRVRVIDNWDLAKVEPFNGWIVVYDD
jgi:hypothetical protein